MLASPLLRLIVIVSLSALSTRTWAITEFDSLCKTDYKTCIEKVTTELTKVPPFKHKWSSLRLYQLDALFHLGQYKNLYDTIEQLLKDEEQLPEQLRLRSYIYFSKTSSMFKKYDQRKFYQMKADSILKDYLENNQHPEKIIEYANIQIYLKDFDEGIKTLVALENKYKSHPDFVTKERIYTNLGNLYSHKNDYESAKANYIKAYENAAKMNVPSREILTLGNIARSYQELGLYEQSIKVFRRVIVEASDNNYPLYLSMANLRMAQIYVNLEQWHQADNFLQLVNVSILRPGLQELFYQQRNLVNEALIQSSTASISEAKESS